MMPEPDPAYDVLIIGAGIAGLIAACQLARSGEKVLLVEKLSFLGGRFSAFPYQGAEISSGAFHTFPHGAGGPMAQSLRGLGIDIEVSKPGVVASFYVNHKHIVSKRPLDLFKVLSTNREKRVVYQMLLKVYLQKEYPGTFADWMARAGASPFVINIFDRFCQFALSTSVHSVPYAEGRKITQHVFRYGLPGIPKGGARGVVQALGRTATSLGVTVWKTTQVERLQRDAGSQKITGAVLYDRRKKEHRQIQACRVISTIGPQATIDLLKCSELNPLMDDWPAAVAPATGLKVHVLSPKSLIDHDSIMFCLDTQRVAGVLQATNADPALAPPGKHLLISHQVIPPGADWQAERALAIEDWQMIFGEAFTYCEVIGASQFPANYPVNWAVQGADIRSQPFSGYGLWLAGDAVKPEGLMMVEGVAASAEQVVSEILAKKH
jgi:phytoene dehydrogenase-like protein